MLKLLVLNCEIWQLCAGIDSTLCEGNGLCLLFIGASIRALKRDQQCNGFFHYDALQMGYSRALRVTNRREGENQCTCFHDERYTQTHISEGLAIRRTHVKHYRNIKSSILGACYEMEMLEWETKVMGTSRQLSPIQITIDQKQPANVEYEYFNCFCSMITYGHRRTSEIKSRIVMAKAVIDKKETFSTN